MEATEPDHIMMPPEGMTPAPVIVTLDASSVVNRPAAGVAPPIGVSLIVPPVNVGPVMVGAVSVLLVSVCVSVVPTTSPLGVVLDVVHADPVETAMPAAG